MHQWCGDGGDSTVWRSSELKPWWDASFWTFTAWRCDALSEPPIMYLTDPAHYHHFLFDRFRTHGHKGTSRWLSPHHLNPFFIFHVSGNLLLYLLVSFCSLLLFNCVLWLFGSSVSHFVCVFRSTGASFKKMDKKKSGSRAVTVKCCRSPCDLEHRNNNCTFSIFIFASS